jgi:hypothetical protein
MLDTDFSFLLDQCYSSFHETPHTIDIYILYAANFTKTLLIFTCAMLISLKLNSSIKSQQLASYPTEYHKLKNDYLWRLHNYTKMKILAVRRYMFFKIQEKI